jgi:uncharacterized membrane protein
MKTDASSRFDKFRWSPLGQRVGSVLLSAFVVAYLAIITYAFSDRLHSTRVVIVFGFLWLLGVAALAILSRPWRTRRTKGQ